MLPSVCVHVDPFKLTNLKQQYTNLSKVTASLGILENLETLFI